MRILQTFIKLRNTNLFQGIEKLELEVEKRYTYKVYINYQKINYRLGHNILNMGQNQFNLMITRNVYSTM